MVLKWFRSADARIAPSDHLAQLAEARGLGPVQVIRHGLDPKWFSTPKRLTSTAPFVHIGTIAHHKGTDAVVAAYRTLPQGPGLNLFGPILDPEAALGHPVGPRLTSQQVRDTLHAAKALVLGSRWAENAPLIIIEARAVGCPIIAPRVGGIPELIDEGVDGYLYELGNEAELAEAMQRILNGPTLHPNKPPHFHTQVDRIERVYQGLHRQSA
jgi:glycosyltransferase involved in cell wall biosynthesis